MDCMQVRRTAKRAAADASRAPQEPSLSARICIMAPAGESVMRMVLQNTPVALVSGQVWP